MAKGFSRLLIGLCALTSPLALSAHALAQTNASNPSANAPQSPALEALDAYIENTRAEWDVPGLSVAIVQDDKILFAKGYGVREAGKSDAVDIDTIFAIGSASKAFTGATLGLLVDEKKIAWDGVAQDYMPDFALSDPYATRRATVRDLMAHRTGFVSGYGWLWTGSGFDRAEIIKRLRHQSDGASFRDTFLYANEIITAAGEIVPAVTGTSWDDFVTARIFQPLGMTRTTTSVTTLPQLGNVATPHSVVDGKRISFPYRNIDNVGGAGAINSSARDMAQWLRLQLGGGNYAGKQILAPATLAETHKGQVTVRSTSGSIVPSKFYEYGLGWVITEYQGNKLVQHGGAVDGMHASVSMIPDKKLGIVILTNRLPNQAPQAIILKAYDTLLGTGNRDWSAELKQQTLAAEARAKAAAKPASGKPVPPSLPLDRYAGSYTHAQHGTLSVSLENGALRLTRPTASAVLKPDQRDRFRARWTDQGILSVYGEIPVGFALSPTGEVIGLDLGPDRFKRDTAAAAR